MLKVALPYGTKDGLESVQSARSLYELEKGARRIITFSRDLDGVLGGGVPMGQITEFCGVPGVGKTQMGIQLAINTALPPAFHGIGGEAVYIDTEGSFMVERCLQMATALCRHLEAAARRKNDPARHQAASEMTPEKILKGIHLFRCRDSVEQLAVMEILPSFLEQHPSVRLIVIDSITFHFRQDYEDLALRTRHLNDMAQKLMALAGERQLAVVMMNQVTTKVLGKSQSRLVPALGDSWAHAATMRIILYWKDRVRHAFVYKSPSLPAAAATYAVTSEGIRSAAKSDATGAQKHGAESAVGSGVQEKNQNASSSVPVGTKRTREEDST